MSMIKTYNIEQSRFSSIITENITLNDIKIFFHHNDVKLNLRETYEINLNQIRIHHIQD